MPGEKLDFPDACFTHSITNLGLLFFGDAGAGAREIWRTLRPGGTALVTCWKCLGYDAVIWEAQRAVRPDAQVFRVPIPKRWFEAGWLEETLREGGFVDVEVSEKVVYYAAGSVEGLMESDEETGKRWEWGRGGGVCGDKDGGACWCGEEVKGGVEVVGTAG
ncbi:hypothetical protein BU26DRAFT_292820 [Trematosphaeria pertusa]|uniref:Methyltransferase type 11 domain-containing protein n=1 Tax=Trematosphaeria pertusa TaxID=390896 RepID=A0A6A6IK35_9PLEO|nr:uncharacterized protein BU26DRAFT_292820 [Trematosphaeria pertusa]KAF2249930.1 hypothetical protein BU26DRAFT_292820 [Trematosphaeria pertusa]